MPYTITAVRQDEKMQSVRSSALIAIAKARIWESEGWRVVIADPDGNECDAGQFDQNMTSRKAAASASVITDAVAVSDAASDDDEAHALSAADGVLPSSC